MLGSLGPSRNSCKDDVVRQLVVTSYYQTAVAVTAVLRGTVTGKACSIIRNAKSA